MYRSSKCSGSSSKQCNAEPNALVFVSLPEPATKKCAGETRMGLSRELDTAAVSLW